MATIQVYTKNNTNPDPIKDQRGCYKRGMFFAVYEDGVCTEVPSPDTPFVFLHFPEVAASRVIKYMAEQMDGEIVIRRRRWRLRWEDLPAAVRNRLISNRQITIAVGSYAGPRDYTWAQVREYFRDLETGLDETTDP